MASAQRRRARPPRTSSRPAGSPRAAADALSGLNHPARILHNNAARLRLHPAGFGRSAANRRVHGRKCSCESVARASERTPGSSAPRPPPPSAAPTALSGHATSPSSAYARRAARIPRPRHFAHVPRTLHTLSYRRAGPAGFHDGDIVPTPASSSSTAAGSRPQSEPRPAAIPPASVLSTSCCARSHPPAHLLGLRPMRYDAWYNGNELVSDYED